MMVKKMYVAGAATILAVSSFAPAVPVMAQTTKPITTANVLQPQAKAKTAYYYGISRTVNDAKKKNQNDGYFPYISAITIKNGEIKVQGHLKKTRNRHSEMKYFHSYKKQNYTFKASKNLKYYNYDYIEGSNRISKKEFLKTANFHSSVEVTLKFKDGKIVAVGVNS